MHRIFSILLFLNIGANPALAQNGQIEIRNDKYGIVDSKTKKLIANFIYDDVETLTGVGYLVMQNEKIGLLNKRGEKIFSCIYEEIQSVLNNPNYVVLEEANGNLSVYSIKDKKFVFNKFQADLHNPLCGPYDELTGSVTKTIIIISKNGKMGILELPSKLILTIEYERIIPCETKPGIVLLQKAAKYRFYDIKGNKLLSPEFELNGYDDNLSISQGSCAAEATDYFPVKVHGKWGIMNMYGKFKIPAKFDDLRSSPYVKGKTAFKVVYTQNKWYSYNYGKIKSFDIDYFLGFWYNYAVVIKNEKVLFYNTKGLKFIEIKLRKPGDTKIRAFQKSGKFGVVSYKSRLIADFEFQNIEINKNLIFATKSNKTALMDSEGKALTTYKYDNISLASAKDRLLIIKQYGKYGLLSFEGNEIVKTKYSYISKFSDGKASVKLYKTEFEIDTKGNKLD